MEPTTHPTHSAAPTGRTRCVTARLRASGLARVQPERCLRHAAGLSLLVLLIVGASACGNDNTTAESQSERPAQQSAAEGNADSQQQGAAETSADESFHAPAGFEPGSYEDWCGGHQVPESACTRCNTSLIPAFQATGDWCNEHGIPESQCKLCNADLVIQRPPRPEGK